MSKAREVLAYCAGVIDSDGCIGVRRSTYAARHGEGVNATYSVRICMKQVQPEAAELLKATFGGSLIVQRPKGHRALHSWECTHRNATTCLQKLLPHLRIKRAQAANGLKLAALIIASKKARMARGRGHQGAGARPAGITAAMDACFQEAKNLNRVGL